nr:PREDICTED: F-box only protein 6-like [Bemisia tabaci]
MGSTVSSVMNSSSSTEIMDPNIDENNGLILNNIFFPEEMLIQILFYVDHDTLVYKGRLVCKVWKRLIESSVLKSKVDEGRYRSLSNLSSETKHRLHLHWSIYYLICKFDLFGKNLIRNPSGKEKLKHWKITQNNGDKWAVESQPHGANPIPGENRDLPCFVTSYHECLKEQLIKLADYGFTSSIMDEIQPIICIQELYSSRFDCGAMYHIHVLLLDEKKEKVIAKFDKDDVEYDRMEWHQVSHEFKNYGPGVRYVKYCHGGRDTQFWAGHYGAKITGSSVTLLYPPPEESPEEEDEIDDSALET